MFAQHKAVVLDAIIRKVTKNDVPLLRQARSEIQMIIGYCGDERHHYLTPPGGPTAGQFSCTCSSEENYHGHGFVIDGDVLWYYEEDCPIHGESVPDELLRKPVGIDSNASNE